MAITPDLTQITTILSQLAQNYNELAQNWFNVFYNRNEMDITLQFYDEDGNLKSYTLPNRAKDFRYIKNGTEDPEGSVAAHLGSLYQKTSDGSLYIKASGGSGVTGWQQLEPVDNIIKVGNKNPNGQVEGKLGDLYVDTTEGNVDLYLKRKGDSGSQFGWEKPIGDDVASKAWCLEEFAQIKEQIGEGVVHKTGDENIKGIKTFENQIVTADANVATLTAGTSTFTGNSTFSGEATFSKVIKGTAYRALSADIAEYYDADKVYKAGTLVQFGGDKEITLAEREVNGIVSTDPAYILNDNKDMENPTLLALTGRIPVRVIGEVHKFDKIVLSDIPGVAKVDNSCYNSIGKALEDNLEDGEKLVECVVKIQL